MKVLITGATGFVGSRVAHLCNDHGMEVVVLSRHYKSAKQKYPFAKVYEWSPKSESIPAEAMVGVTAVVNLMGENISQKWDDKTKKRIIDSRVNGTAKVVAAINSVDTVKVFLSASAIGFYPVNQDLTITEETPMGTGFLSELCSKWEKASLGTKVDRLINLRIGVVLGEDGGALEKLLPIFKLGAGGPVGSGKMMMSWIHVDDLAKAIVFCLENNQANGPINATAPHAVSNKVFSKSLAKSLNRPCLFPVPPIILKMVYGEMSTIILDGQKIVPKKLEELDFAFQFPNIDMAMNDIAKRA